MNCEAAPAPTDEQTLTEITSLGMRMARVLVHVAEVEQVAVDIVTADLPKGAQPGSASEARAAGATLDGLAEWMAGAVPRLDMLARALERIMRSVRRGIALKKRMQAGWPRVRSADDQSADNRAAMARRHVKRGVVEVIRRMSDGADTAERLFDELYERLEDPGLDQELLDAPVAEIVRRICRDLGLAANDMQAAASHVPASPSPARGRGSG